MKDGVSEIDFSTYAKIYDNYEFAINENEFLFYESQIENSENKDKNIIPANFNSSTIRNLYSKYFKKGTFIWICKKIQENVILNILSLSHKIFLNLFDKKHSKVIESLYNYVIDIFNKKVNDIIEKSKNNFKLNSQGGYICTPDPVFFKEGILSFYFSFCETLQKINNENINSEQLSENILKFSTL